MTHLVPEPSPSALRLLLASLRLDCRVFVRNLWLNRIVASFIVPKVLRRGLYRAAGMAVDSYVISPLLRVEGDPRNVRIGPHTYLNLGCYIEAVAPVEIGRNCSIGMEVLLITSDHRAPGGGWVPEATGLPVRIGDRVWIGARATILPGVTVGDDVVVAAGAVVTSDCAPNGVYAGVPARRVRDLAVPDPRERRASA
ncbi:DapH/DapD/GlmU-related protein [Modestobacter sp. VKM Ac-2983]|uniref:acyltransferase n=1 Tax=Modestobacter sp. VKM Ac-2983 TaxID=3004137 RepID=UPI0022ABA60E|nr:DapH/DapD/GlmU-related protein [Modestobacter sp. VKM Ac-2983]MCZ2803718.1 DapH/DapD/GlmU-related protein [Modestobacter sp. VKM Ac-2983]